jgi:uncharacterized spore protein YtfJ
VTSEGSDRSDTFVDSAARELHSALEPVAQISVDQVFREPVQSGDVVVIAAAAISKGGGFGFGGGTDPRHASTGGGGGGATVLAGAFGIWRASRRGRRG